MLIEYLDVNMVWCEANNPNIRGVTMYVRSVSELQEKAINWWPQVLVETESSTSIIPLLLKTQDQFLSILKLSGSSPQTFISIVNDSNFAANLFLKHLVVLSDFGGETLQRLNTEFRNLMSIDNCGKCYLEYVWDGVVHIYNFAEMPIIGNLNNAKLRIDGKQLSTPYAFNGLLIDICMILLFGSSCTNEETANILYKCEIGALIGKTDEIEKFVKERYIYVSRITGGAQANSLGQIAQTYVFDYLKTGLGNEYSIAKNGHIPGITQNNGRSLTTFDLVISKGSNYVAIEISFQVTTNSTIERKAGQAENRFRALHKSGNFIAYIIDGAGNFQRNSALTTICNNSDCTVAFSEAEFDLLLRFLKEKLW